VPTDRSKPKKAPAVRPQTAAHSVEWQAAALLLIIVFLTYVNCFGLGIALDGHLVVGDARGHGVTWQNLKLIFGRNYFWPYPNDGLYRPLTTLSFLFNYSVLGNGENAAGYHVFNVVLHLCNVLLVYLLVRRWFESRWAPFFAAALWAVHPVCSDTVANMAGRADLLAVLAILGGLLLYERAAGGGSWLTYAGLFAVALCAVFAKETGAMLLPLMLLSDLVRVAKPDGGRRRILAYGVVFAALIGYAGIRTAVLASLPTPVIPYLDNPLIDAGFWQARWTAIKVAGMDLALLVWPASLSSDRSFHQIPLASAGDAAAWLSLLVIVGVVSVAAFRRRTDPVLFWCAGLFGLALLPASNLLIRIGATMAERFLYLPSIGFAAAATVLLYRFAPPRTVPVVLGAIVFLCSIRTFARNSDWKDDLTLTRHDSESAPGSFRTHEMYGEFAQIADPHNLDLAIRELEASTAILSSVPPDRNYSQPYASLGMYYGLKGETASAAEAAVWYGKSLAALEQADRISRAVEARFDAVQAAAGKPPGPRQALPRTYMLLGATYFHLGRTADAIAAWRFARSINPDLTESYDRVISAYAADGHPDLAVREVLARQFALGSSVAAMDQIATLYAKVPGGDCAVDRRSGIPMLNGACPRLQSDVCAALADMRRVFQEARRAAALSGTAAQYGCR